MAITYPIDLLAAFPGWSVSFELFWRQEQSRQANGRTIVKDFGSPLWQASYASRSLSPNELDSWRAKLDALENGLKTFKGVQLSRCYPILYPNATGMGDVAAAAVSSINANRKAIKIDGLPVGYTLSVGDMIKVGTRNLHRVQESAIADGAGITTEFEIRPHLWPETAIDDAVVLVRPSCVMSVIPASIASTADAATGRGAVSFQAIEAR